MKAFYDVALVSMFFGTLVFSTAVADADRSPTFQDARAQIESAFQQDHMLEASVLRLQFMSELSTLLEDSDTTDEFATLWLTDTNYWAQKFTNEDRPRYKRYYFDLYGENLTILGEAVLSQHHEMHCKPLRNILQTDLLARYFGQDILETVDSSFSEALINQATQLNLRDDKVRTEFGSLIERHFSYTDRSTSVSTTDLIYVVQHQALQRLIHQELCER
ncbi:MAG: hypothetical protein KDC47_06670 [Flavobacteriaceae bacterium]|nr:hypothetical protein [Flavobacteriaceae bacterium]